MLLCCAILQLIVLLSVQVRGALETLLGALTPIDHARAQKTEVQAALMNSDLLSREAENITLLLSLLVSVYSVFDKKIFLFNCFVRFLCMHHMVCCPGGMAGGRRFLCSILHSSDFDSSSYEFSKQVYILENRKHLSVIFLSISCRDFCWLLFRLQEAILNSPRGITRLMDMLMEREVYD